MNRAFLATLLTISLCACGGGETPQPAPGGGETKAEVPKSDAGATTPQAEAPKAEAPKGGIVEVKNPWGSFKPGSYAKVKSTGVMEIAGNKTTTSSEMKQTLIEITGDKAVIETELTVAGMPPNKSRAEVPLKAGVTPTAAPDAPKPKEGEEEITVMGKTFKCKTMEIDTEAGGVKNHTKAWMSEEVPGFAVKSVVTMDGSVKGETTMELVEYEAK